MEFKFIRNFWHDRLVIIVVIVSALINLANWSLVAYRLALNSEVTALHYNVYFGIDWLGSGNLLYIYPLLALFILAVNLLLAWFLYSQQKILAYFLLFISGFVNTSLFLSSALIFLFVLS